MTETLNALVFAPTLPIWLYWALSAAAIAVTLIGVGRRARGFWWRALALAVLLVALADPRFVDESRTAQPDVAVVVVDDSRSMTSESRRAASEAALGELLARLDRQKDLEVRVERTEPPTSLDEGTRLFRALSRAVSDIPAGRMAGAILITDGQVHDVPDPIALPFGAPVHTLLVGGRGERDRRLEIVRAPAFSLVGQKAEVTFRVLDEMAPGAAVPVDVVVDGEIVERRAVVPGQEVSVTLPVGHSGDNVIEMAVPVTVDELTPANNRTAAIVRGVRDRLKVLLVSGRPHAGERAWRDLLKSDPNVDLVHFTILRPMEKNDVTPLQELALIAFPIAELFQEKIAEFDMIVFDRYDRIGLIPNNYLDNIARFVRNGGALLTAVGPEYADALTLYQSPLRDILPAAPTTALIDAPFRPALTDKGNLHPVTAPLGADETATRWGRWLRQVGASPAEGATVLMRGAGDAPLLVLRRIGKGRAAILLSDTIWLWGRGFDGGGPQAELMRRLAHWLMKEPELEEEALRAEIDGTTLTVRRRSLDPAAGSALVTLPAGGTEALALTVGEDGQARGVLTVNAPGLYRVDDGTRKTAVVAGRLNPQENADVRATDTLLAPVAATTGGGVYWLRDDGFPDVRRSKPGRTASGRRWLGLHANGDYVVTGLAEIPLLPSSVALLAALIGLGLAWWREGRAPVDREA